MKYWKEILFFRDGWPRLEYPPHERLTPEIAVALRDNYKLKANSGRYWVYEPK